MSWARFTPGTVSDEIKFTYQIGEDTKELTIKARRITPTEPVLSSTLYVNWTTRADRYEGCRWDLENGIYFRRGNSIGSGQRSYFPFLTNANPPAGWNEKASIFNDMLLELEEYAPSIPENLIVMSSEDSTQLYNRSGIDTATKGNGQECSYPESGSAFFTLFGETAYNPDPYTRSYNGGLFGVRPDPEGPTYLRKALNNIGIFETSDPPFMAFFTIPVQMDDAENDGTHYGETVPCLLVLLKTPGNTALYLHTIISLNAFDSSPVEDEPTTDDQSQTVTPSGWVGDWDYSSESDSVQPVTGYDFVNRWAHGVRLYYISDTQAESFMSALWSTNLSQAFDLAFDSAVFAKNVDFIRGVICLHKLPVVISTSDTSPLSIMGYDLSTKFSGLDAFAKVSDTYGSVKQVTTLPLNIKETYGDAVFMDWINCRAHLRLPFVGMVPIDIRSIRGGSIKVSYNIDILTGNLIAQVFCTSSVGDLPTVLLYQGSGNCALPIPFSGNTQGAFKQLGAVAGIAGGLAAGIATGSAATALQGLNGLQYGRNTGEFHYTATEAASLTDLSIKLIISGDVPMIPPKQRALEGFQAAASANVCDFVGSGFLSGTIHAEILGATDAELAEIEADFSEGVIL